MAEHTKALVKPELLIWARESVGFSIDEAAKKVQVKQEKLRAWELGDEKPTFKQLMTLAQSYKRPLAAFYLPKPPIEPDVTRDFRMVMGAAYKDPSPKLRIELRKTLQRREDTLGLYDLLEEEPSDGWASITYSEEVSELAKSIRNVLQVSIERQLSWKDEYKALAGWINAIEEIGVLVFQSTRIPLEEMRGFSIAFKLLPIITLNGSDAPYAKIFTLIHELAHIISRKDDGNDLWIDYGLETQILSEKARVLEVFCNRVAAEVLVPEQIFREIVSQHKYDWSNTGEVQSLSRMFSVSLEVIYRRLLTIGIIQENLYRYLREQFSVSAKSKKKGKAIVSQGKLAVRNNGRIYTNLVLNAYRREEISLKNVSDYLSVKVRHLPDIQRILASSYSSTLEDE